MMNSTSSTVRDALQPVRESRSANSMDTRPVSNTAEEKNKNSRHPRRRLGGETVSMFGVSAMRHRFHDLNECREMTLSSFTRNMGLEDFSVV